MSPGTRDDGEAIRDLVAECIARMEEHGAAALEEMCREHPEHATVLRRRVALLEGLSSVTGQVERDLPEKLGDFRILRPLGGGGMGVVYLALQESLGREVALKVIRPEQLYFPRARERFRREVETIARLKHPGIVPIYAVGEENGVPYFAMERVRGRSLEAVLDGMRGRKPETLAGHDLAPEGSSEDYLFHGSWEHTCLRIVKQVAEALAHAHELGVLHRDVKPSNVMLASDGPSRALLLDFGLATAEGSERLTRTGAQLGTLHYMAPEQVRGDAEAIGPHSDVYSLGVTLYELLTLTRAFSGLTDPEVAIAIQEGRKRSIRELNPSISRDAETVCSAAMESDPARRYATAADFARDLGNVLERRPIEARRMSTTARAARWMRRHPSGTAALALALLVVIGGPISYAVLESRAGARIREQRDRAEASLDQALAAVDRMLVRVGAIDLQFVPQMEPVRKQLLQDAADLLRGLIARTGDDPRVRMRAAMARERLAELFTDLGQLDEAAEAFAATRAELASLPPDGGADLDRLRLLARTCMHGGVALAAGKQRERALEQFDELQRLLEALPEARRNEVEWRELRARREAALAGIWRENGEIEAAQEGLRTAIAGLEDLIALDPEQDYRRVLGDTLCEYGLLLLDTGPQSALNEPAQKVFERGIELLDGLVQEFPDDPHYVYVRATLRVNLAGVWMRAKELARAEELYQAALPDLERIARDFQDVGFRFELASCWNQLGLCADLADHDAVAEERYRRGVTELRVVVERSPDQHLLINRLGIAEFNLAAKLDFRGALQEARDGFERSVAAQRAALRIFPDSPRYPEDLSTAWRSLMIVCHELGDHHRAAEACEGMAAARPASWEVCTRAAAGLAKCIDIVRASGADGSQDLIADYAKRACAELRAAIERGMPEPGEIRDAPPLAALHGSADFDALVATLP